MSVLVKRLLKLFIILAILAAAGYGAYVGYNYAIVKATEKIKKGVSEGISKGIVDTVNPLKWPEKLFK